MNCKQSVQGLYVHSETSSWVSLTSQSFPLMSQTFHLYSRPPQYSPSQCRRPPNTAAHFQVPNMGFICYIWLPIPPFSEYCRFLASPKIGGIEGFDCIPMYILLEAVYADHIPMSLYIWHHNCLLPSFSVELRLFLYNYRLNISNVTSPSRGYY